MYVLMKTLSFIEIYFALVKTYSTLNYFLNQTKNMKCIKILFHV